MDELRDLYRRERKRARDILYKARQSGYDLYATDLPEIPEIITEEAIDELIDFINKVKEGVDVLGDLEDSDRYADRDETTDVSILRELNDVMSRLFDMLDDTVFLDSPKSKGWLYIGPKNFVKKDTDTDKADIKTIWRNVYDDMTNSVEDAKKLYIAVISNISNISYVLNQIQFVDYKLQEYLSHLSLLMTVFDYLGASTESIEEISRLETNYYEDGEEYE